MGLGRGGRRRPGVVAGAWLLDRFRQPQSGFQFARLDDPRDEHFLLNQTTYGDLVPAVREAIRDAVETGRAGTSLPEEDFEVTRERLEAASRDQTGDAYLRTFDYGSTYLRYEMAQP